MKRKKKSRKRIGRFAKFLLLVILGVTAVGFAAVSPLCNITGIVVKGSTRYTPQDITGLSGIQTGQNAFKAMAVSPRDILRLRFGEAERLIEENRPYVKEAIVRLAVPSRVVIEIKERQPAAIATHLGTSLLIDREGAVLEPILDGKKKGLPVINGLAFVKYQIGKPLVLDKPDSLNLAFELLDVIRQSDGKLEEINKSSGKQTVKLGPKVNWVDAGDLANIRILLDNRIKVNLGDLQDLNYRLDATRVILSGNIKKEDRGELDFSTGAKPVFKPE